MGDDTYYGPGQGCIECPRLRADLARVERERDDARWLCVALLDIIDSARVRGTWPWPVDVVTIEYEHGVTAEQRATVEAWRLPSEPRQP